MVLIQNPTIGRKLQRLLRLTSLPDSVLAPETVPVIIVEDVSAPLSDIERGCAGSQSVAGAVAENAMVTIVRVGDPAPYNLLITEAHFSSSSANRIIIRRPTVELAGLTISPSTTFTDFTIPGRPTSQLGSDSIAGLPVGLVLYEAEIEADVFYRVPLKVRLGGIEPAGSNSLIIGAIEQNTILRAGFLWTEGPNLG